MTVFWAGRKPVFPSASPATRSKKGRLAREDEQDPFKIRYMQAVLDKGAKPVRRYFKQDVLVFLPRPEWSKYSNGLVLSGLAAGQGRGLWRLLGTISGRTQVCLFNKRRQLTPDGFRREIVLKKCSLTLNGVQKVVSSNLTAPTNFPNRISKRRAL